MTLPCSIFIRLETGMVVEPSTTCTVPGIPRIALRLGLVSASEPGVAAISPASGSAAGWSTVVSERLMAILRASFVLPDHGVVSRKRQEAVDRLPGWPPDHRSLRSLR